MADHWGHTLYVSPDGSAAFTQIFSEGDVIEFRDRQDRLFIFGSEGIEPSGIWEHDLTSHDTRCVVRPTERPFSFAKTITHSSVVISNGNEEIIGQLWRPTTLPSGRKYPLILTQTPYRWTPYPNMAACAGYYFLAINRKSWEEGIDTWESDVMTAYKELAKDPHIDLSRVFLLGFSAETDPISHLAAERPDLWKGVVMQSPEGLPDVLKTKISTMLIQIGEKDPKARQRIPPYLDESARHGIATRVIIYPNARHTSWSRTTEGAKVEEMADFLSRN